METMQLSTKEDLYVLRHLLSILIGSYVIGWLILVVNLGRVPLLHPFLWQAGSVAAAVLTVWLAVSLSRTALIWWSAVTLSIVTVRSFAYAKEGIFNPFGVWLLVLAGVLVTGLAVISVNVLTGGMEKLRR